jgi:hypothetical protein
MRKFLMLTTAIAALIAISVVGIASAGNKPVTVRAGNLNLTFNGGFRPTALPKHKFAPIKLNASGKIATVDGTHPPALKEFILETDKNGTINTKGVATCKAGKLQATDTKAAEKACKAAIIGSGTTTAEVEFAESNPIDVNSKLLVFNGGTKGGKTTLYIHAYFSSPVSGAIVTTVKIKKIHKGPYGIESVATIPKIAGGAGSVTSFSLNITKKGVLTAKCPSGKLLARGEAKFADGTRAKAGIARPCRGK